MAMSQVDRPPPSVAPLTGSVDWNIRDNDIMEYADRRSPHGERGLKSSKSDTWLIILVVAPLTGSVDWNKMTSATACCPSGRSPHGERGLKFGVLHRHRRGRGSLPSRGAWIEIITSHWLYHKEAVALLGLWLTGRFAISVRFRQIRRHLLFYRMTLNLPQLIWQNAVPNLRMESLWFIWEVEAIRLGNMLLITW